MADNTEFRLVEASARRAARLEREYAKAYLEQAPPGRRFIGAQFCELCDVIDQSIDAYAAQYTGTDDSLHREIVLDAARELLFVTRDLQRRRAWLDAARETPIDLGSFYFLSALAKRIVRADLELTIVPADEGSYATMVNPFRFTKYPAPTDIVLVALVPRREVRSGLLHPLLVHEIGHGVANVHDFTNRLQSSLVTPVVEAILEEGAKRAAAESGRSESDERVVLDSRLGCWIEEIFCDAIATACLGVTYLFSFATEVMPDDLDAAGAEHPPTRQRVRLMIEHLDRIGWGELLSREVPNFINWLRAEANASPAGQSAGDEALRLAINEIAREIQDEVDNHVGVPLAPDTNGLAAVEQLLEQNVPPAQHEDGTAISRPTIIAGCWLAALKNGGGTLDALAEAVDSDELEELLPYALELSVVVDRWQAA